VAGNTVAEGRERQLLFDVDRISAGNKWTEVRLGHRTRFVFLHEDNSMAIRNFRDNWNGGASDLSQSNDTRRELVQRLGPSVFCGWQGRVW